MSKGKKKVRIVTGNEVYGFKGTLFHKFQPNTRDVIDHELDAELADELLAQDDTPFREVDAKGNVVKLPVDEVAEKAAADDIASRTVLSDSAKKALADEAASEGADTAEEGADNAEAESKPEAKEEAKPKKKTITVGSKAKTDDDTSDAVDV